MARVTVTATIDIDHAERQLLEAVSMPGFGPIASNGLLAVRALRVALEKARGFIRDNLPAYVCESRRCGCCPRCRAEEFLASTKTETT